MEAIYRSIDEVVQVNIVDSGPWNGVHLNATYNFPFPRLKINSGCF